MKLQPTKLPHLTRAALQGRLLSLPGNSIFAESVRQGAVKDLKGTVRMILDQAKDNREAVMSVIGVKLLIEIEQRNS